mgnify:CR=1 FL=1
MDDNCKELLNIKYKNMLLNPNNNIFNNSENDNSQTLDSFLENHKPVVKVKSWSQLNKMEKLRKLNKYVDSISSEYELTSKDIEDMKQYLKKCLNRNQLIRIKDVQYDKKMGIVTKINGLHIRKGKIDGKERKFTLKNVDKKDSTLKNLGSGKINRSKMLSKHRKSKKDIDNSDTSD